MEGVKTGVNLERKIMTDSKSRVVALDGGINRDLGGYTNKHGRRVKWRKIMRCGHLASLSDSDLDTLEQIGISKVHDFRREEEQVQSPSSAIRAEFIDDYQILIGDISRFWEFLLVNSPQSHPTSWW